MSFRISRQQEEEREPVQIGPIITETLNLLRASLPSTIEIRENVEDGQAIVLAESTKMQQVVMDLCTNAYHAMREK
jgi:C4-dicarboxylate-specific signal transduction histidine kinase